MTSFLFQERSILLNVSSRQIRIRVRAFAALACCGIDIEPHNLADGVIRDSERPFGSLSAQPQLQCPVQLDARVSKSHTMRTASSRDCAIPLEKPFLRQISDYRDSKAAIPFFESSPTPQLSIKCFVNPTLLEGIIARTYNPSLNWIKMLLFC